LNKEGLAYAAPALFHRADPRGGGHSGSTTECATPGNVQINATSTEPTYLYPWDDEFYGPALTIGGGGAHGR
jgi:hypothetical protein